MFLTGFNVLDRSPDSYSLECRWPSHMARVCSGDQTHRGVFCRAKPIPLQPREKGRCSEAAEPEHGKNLSLITE